MENVLGSPRKHRKRLRNSYVPNASMLVILRSFIVCVASHMMSHSKLDKINIYIGSIINPILFADFISVVTNARIGSMEDVLVFYKVKQIL